MKKVFAFDMGKASIGYCVREDFNIKDLGSLIIDKDHSSVADNRNRRRTRRTLNSHRAREEWFKKLWTEKGLNVLDKTDKKFKQEFAPKGDNTIYNSTRLRCALLQGKKLEEWQIYKALHSAIQRRGYDSNIAWATSEDDKENEEAIKKYACLNGIELINSDEYKYPCYYDALLLGLWEETNPNELKRSIGLNPQKIRTSGRVAPRELVIKELTKLWEEAKKQLPQIQNVSVDEFLYGDYREAYASYHNPEWIQYRGTTRDWQGVLGQKIPRFNNRVISKCRLLPKRNVCSAETIEHISLVLLMQLKNIRFIDNETLEQRRLSPMEIKEIYDKKVIEWAESLTQLRRGEKKSATFSIPKTDIEKVVGQKFKKNEVETLKANTSGRSSFCRRACEIMIDVVTSGLYPMELDIEKYVDKDNVKNGITREEILSMLSKIGDWNNLFIGDNRDEIAEASHNADIKSDILIGNITNPVVRNRLQIFKNLLNKLIEDNGKPDEVIFEFVRDGADNSLFGSIKANATMNYMKNQEKENEQLIKELEEHGIDPKQYFLMHKLCKAQDYKCIYSGERISPTEYPLCEIDHIYPRTMGGNDALYNKVVCYKKENQDKKGRTPYQWLSSDRLRWEEFNTRVNNLRQKLGKKKSDLLILPPEKCEKLIDSYNGLAETAQVAKVASAITHYICGWGMQVAGQERHVYVENGSTTAKIRRTYSLNTLLGDDEKKNRSNPKHHALDAICISFSREYKLNEETNRYSIKGFDRPQVEEKIRELMPYPYSHKKPLKTNTSPLETIYGKRMIGDKAYITSRVSLETIKQDMKAIKNIIDKDIKEDLTQKIEEKMSANDWVNMLKNYIHPKKKTKVNKVLTIVSEGTLETDENGRERIGEYADFGNKGTKSQFKHSKGHKGQILYYDPKGSIRVMPIFANKSTKEVKEKLLEMGCKLYNGGEVFYSGCLIEIPNDFKAGALTYPKGVYKSRTILQKGDVKIESNIGQEILTSAKNLALAGFKKLKD